MRRFLALAVVMPGCVWISDEEHASRVDRDGDGVVMLGYGDGADCDDHDPDVLGPETWFADSDGDGFGDPDSTIASCAPPSGFVADASDCDDSDGAVHPDAVEICSDGKDNDCDGATCLPGGDYELPLGPVVEGLPVGATGAVVVDVGGDVHGDGAHDLVLGAPGGGGSGLVYLFAGPFSNDLSVADADSVISGPAATAEAGAALGFLLRAPDGPASIVIGAPGVDLVATDDFDDVVDGGALYMLDGVPVGEVSLAEHPALVEGRVETQLGVVMEELGFGERVSLAPDLDGDGGADLLVSAVGYDGGSFGRLEDSGAWFVVPGSLTGTTYAGDLERLLHGTDSWSVARGPLALADFAGDGVVQLVLTGSRVDDDSTAVFLAEVPDGVVELEEGLLAVTGSELSDQEFGAELLVVDFDEDGVDDLMVAAPGELSDVGAVYVFYGGPEGVAVDLDADLRLIGDAEGDRFGDALSFGSDLDGDGRPELIIGAPGVDGGAGRVYAFAEAITGQTDGRDAGWTLLPSSDSPLGLGASLSAGADLDGDRYGDIAAGVRSAEEASVLLIAGGAL